MNILKATTVEQLLKQHPEAVNFFFQRGMLCVGCPTESLHTLADVARIYGHELNSFLNDLRLALRSLPEKSH